MVFTGTKFKTKTSKFRFVGQHSAKLIALGLYAKQRTGFLERRNFMTRNQIEYSKLKETQRSNQMNEGLTQRRDTNTYLLGSRQLGETQRHNREMESQGRLSLDETKRSNQMREAISLDQLAETQRSNLASEALRGREADIKQGELEVHKGTLEETRRSNLSREEIQRNTLSETIRSNKVREQETARHDVQTERNQRYSAQMQYAGTKYNADQAYAAQQNATYQRDIASQRSLQLGREQLEQKTINDTRNRMIGTMGTLENMRANRASEGLRRDEVTVKQEDLSERQRHQQAVEAETQRHNVVTEATNIGQSLARSILGGINNANQVGRIIGLGGNLR